MKLLPDTHLLLWAAGAPGKLSRQALDLVENEENTLLFSPARLDPSDNLECTSSPT
uniref:PIN domain-containing protein n=1 Tax=Candidatus Kentrum sp. DK TaxID=2126562 RepID=A0A450TFC9_9GAMM|nr:MAG: hypothetical protein BECKDK2373C_GA0170839_11378 [Candidatus Kentron sp. DK]